MQIIEKIGETVIKNASTTIMLAFIKNIFFI